MTVKQPPKILCAIGHGLYKPWVDILFEGQEQTWLTQNLSPNIEIVHFHGTPVSKLFFKLDQFHEKIRWSRHRWSTIALKYFDLFVTYPFLSVFPAVTKSKLMDTFLPAYHVQFPDIYLTVRWKDLSFLKYALENMEFDYIFMTTTSSYINLDKLEQTISTLPTKRLYAGYIPIPSWNFASGSNRIFSRDVIEDLVNNPKLFTCSHLEDVGIGNALTKLGYKATPLQTLNIPSEEFLDSLSDSELNSTYHLRVKSGSLDNRRDIPIMKKLHSRLVNLR